MQSLKPSKPRRRFNAWLEDWEKPLLKKNDCVAEAKLLEKYKGLVLYDIDEEKTYTVYEKNMFYQKGRGGGWCILAAPPEFDGENDDLLEPYMVNEETLIYLIENTEQPSDLNVEIVKKSTGNSDTESEAD